MPVRALTLLAVLAISTAWVAADEYEDLPYLAGDEAYAAYDEPFDDSDDTTYATAKTRRGVQHLRSDDGETHRFEDYVHIQYVEPSKPRNTRPVRPVHSERPARMTHFSANQSITASDEEMPIQPGERVYSDYEEVPLQVYEDFGSCDSCAGDDICSDCQAACGSCNSCNAGCGGCGGCNSCCGGLSAGAEMTILNFHPDGGRGSDLFGIDGDYNHNVAPRVWLGYEGASGWGVRGRFWQYDTGSNNTFFVDTDERFVLGNVCNTLNTYMIDLELTKRFCLGRTRMRTSIGARNGAIRRRTVYGLGIIDDDGSDEDATALIADAIRVFDGTGLTFAFEANRPLFGTQLEAVVNARGSALWGDNKQSVLAKGAEALPDGMGNLDVNVMTQEFHGDESDTMWIGELQAGLQWTQPYQCFGGGVMFVRSVFEAQWWAQPNLEVGDFGTIPTEHLAFYGVSVAAGFSY
ncbi:MAG: hypothetical protein R3C10_19690 [Pirellulales bacterium]